jgi:hypothetical protein
MSKITAERLRELLHYDPETGIFTWLTRATVSRRWNTRYVGTTAGSVDCHGYIAIKLIGQLNRAHRLAWLYMTGEWPSNDIDHINGNRADNRLENLRPATRSQNNANSRTQSRNTSGLKGVHKQSRGYTWAARIKINGSQHYLGNFKTPESAHAAYIVAAEKLFGEFARAN